MTPDRIVDRREPDPSTLTTAQLLREVANMKELIATLFAGVKEMTTEKFAAFETQLVLIERQRIEQKADTEKAVQAALSAAKEAVKEQTTASGLAIGKAETSTAEQLKQLNITIGTAVAGVNMSLNDVKERVVKMESVKQGGHDWSVMAISVAGLLFTIIAVVFAVYVSTHK